MHPSGFSTKILVEKRRYGVEAQTFPVGPSPKAAQDDSLYTVAFLRSRSHSNIHEHYCLVILPELLINNPGEVMPFHFARCGYDQMIDKFVHFGTNLEQRWRFGSMPCVEFRTMARMSEITVAGIVGTRR